MENNMMTMEIKDYVEDLLRANKDISVFSLENFIYFSKANNIMVSNKESEYSFEIAHNNRKAGFSFIVDQAETSKQNLLNAFKKFAQNVTTEYIMGSLASKESKTIPSIDNFPLYMQNLEIDSREIFCKWKAFIEQVQRYDLFLTDVVAGKTEIDTKQEADFELAE